MAWSPNSYNCFKCGTAIPAGEKCMACKEKGSTVTKKLERTSRGLRDILFDEMEELRSGEGDPQKALAVAVLSQKIMNTVRVEMEYHRLTQRTDDKEPPKIGTLELGTVASAEKAATGR